MQESKRDLVISVISTILNESSTIEAFINSLLAQTKKPDEVVILDGGSSDGTIEIIHNLSLTIRELHFIIDPTCNIKYTPSPVAKGRNIAIRNAKGNILAVTDAGCMLDPCWLEEITQPFIQNKEIDLVGGWYEPWIDTKFEKASAAVSFTVTKDQIKKNFFPSSRSVAFTRSIWEKVGGYPEVALTAEDALFDKHLQLSGANFFFTDKAIVYWKPRSDFTSLMRQFYRYSKGDAICGLQTMMHAKLFAKFAVFIGLMILSLSTKNLLGIYLTLVLSVAYFFMISRLPRYQEIQFLASVLKISIHISRILGYCVGIVKRMQGSRW